VQLQIIILNWIKKCSTKGQTPKKSVPDWNNYFFRHWQGYAPRTFAQSTFGECISGFPPSRLCRNYFTQKSDVLIQRITNFFLILMVKHLWKMHFFRLIFYCDTVCSRKWRAEDTFHHLSYPRRRVSRNLCPNLLRNHLVMLIPKLNVLNFKSRMLSDFKFQNLKPFGIDDLTASTASNA
jgi:hypothetical protein